MLHSQIFLTRWLLRLFGSGEEERGMSLIWWNRVFCEALHVLSPEEPWERAAQVSQRQAG